MAVDEAMVASLRAAMVWLYDEVQPDDSIPPVHGFQHRVGDRVLTVCSDGYCPELPVLILTVADPAYRAGTNVVTNGPTRQEAEQLGTAVVSLGWAGVGVSDIWETNGAQSLTLTRATHPTLRAGRVRYLAGCPDHEQSVSCWRDHSCIWLQRGINRTTPPKWPTRVAA